MASSPSNSSLSASPPSAKVADALLQQESDAFSDDSGVDVKSTQGGRRHLHLQEEEQAELSNSRRNKRKSTEPRRRKDVLLMKRFRWEDTDDEDIRDEDNEDFDALEREDVRPGSGDSACRLEYEDISSRPHAESPSRSAEKKNGSRQWRKPPKAVEQQEDPEDTLPTFSNGCRLEQTEESEDMSSPRPCGASPSRSVLRKNVGSSRQWRKPLKSEPEGDQEDSPLPASRQSVICINETTNALLKQEHNEETTRSVASTTTCTLKTDEDSSVASEDRACYLEDPGQVHLCRRQKRGGDCGGSPGRGGAVSPASSSPRPPHRNYKSMSRQRRIEANARERTRVHTISAAFESLRRAVPAYAHNQKLSKLAILRIASAYIVALACLSNGSDGGGPPAPDTMSECVEQCTRTIQAEGRSRRRTSGNKE